MYSISFPEKKKTLEAQYVHDDDNDVCKLLTSTVFVWQIRV